MGARRGSLPILATTATPPEEFASLPFTSVISPQSWWETSRSRKGGGGGGGGWREWRGKVRGWVAMEEEGGSDGRGGR